MKRTLSLLFLIPVCFGLVACGDSGNAGSGEPNFVSTSTSSSAGRFSKDIGKGCEVLTAEMVGAIFNMPADNFKQTKVLGCIYTWKNETDQANGRISMLRAHKSTAQAAAWFNRATADRSVEEVQAEMDKVSNRLQEGDELDSDDKKTMVKTMLNAIGAQAVKFAEVTGVGDEARSSGDGSIFVRVDNLTFVASGYQGANEPDMDFSGMAIKRILEASKKHSKAWAAETLAQRTKDGVQIAAAIVDTL